MSSTTKLVLGLAALSLLGVGALAALRFSGGPLDMDHSGDAAPSANRTSHPSENLVLMESASGVDDKVAARLAETPGVARVHRYLVGTLDAGTPIVGLAPLTAPLLSPDGELLSPRFLAGRPLPRPASTVRRRWSASGGRNRTRPSTATRWRG